MSAIKLKPKHERGEKWIDNKKLHAELLAWVAVRWPTDAEFQRLIPYAILSALDQQRAPTYEAAKAQGLRIFDWFCQRYGGLADKMAEASSLDRTGPGIVTSQAYAATKEDVDAMQRVIQAHELGVDLLK